MNTKERRKEIIAIIGRDGIVKSTDLVKRFNVSGETIRRDLEHLQSKDVLNRILGGATLNTQNEVYNESINDEHSITTNSIAKAAADLVKPGDTVFLDAGNAMHALAKHLKSRSNITVITSSLAVLNELVDSDITLITLGGIVSTTEGDIYGDLAVECAHKFYCDKVFFSCSGITPELGVMDYGAGNMTIHRHFFKRTDQYILVADSSKFGKKSTMTLCPVTDLDLIITDSDISEDHHEALEALNVKLFIQD
ncbi:MAG: DeoR/GlpR family DNA-binding transcription regulator [Eubacteriales bacterium]|nr:DeoR/GlpR family DNA-binding transcription regulator [Eubacteriales bacterium]